MVEQYQLVFLDGGADSITVFYKCSVCGAGSVQDFSVSATTIVPPEDVENFEEKYKAHRYKPMKRAVRVNSPEWEE
jgi:hypothetical protein